MFNNVSQRHLVQITVNQTFVGTNKTELILYANMNNIIQRVKISVLVYILGINAINYGAIFE